MNSSGEGGHGGKRKGAGRPPGALTAKTRAIAEQAAKSGITPLEVMLKAMEANLRSASRAKGERRLELMAAAAGHAKDAAPYMHARLAAVDHTQGGGKDLPPPGPAPVTVVAPTIIITKPKDRE